MNVEHAVAAFLGRNDFDVRGPAVRTVIDTLLYDMEEGLIQNPESPPQAGPALDMIPTWLVPPEQPPKNKNVIVIDAGGTNFRSCLVHFDEAGIPSISDMERQPMPATDREYSKQAFFDTMASYLDHVKDKADSIGFCFSYAMRITPEGDGQVLQFSKEIKAPEVVGCLVGKSLSEALAARGWKKKVRIVLLNDTASALLAGASTAVNGKRYGSYVGFILGTGMNAAYIEYGTIAKAAQLYGRSGIPEAKQSPQIVVCESGKSNKIPRSRFDRLFAETTNVPAIYWFEKMCSGAYLGSLAAIILREAAADKLLSEKPARQFAGLTVLAPLDIDRFLSAPYAENTLLGAMLAEGTDDDREIVFRLLDAVIMRAARLAAGNIAASVIKTGKGSNPLLPVCVLAEGTTFLKAHRLRSTVTRLLDTVLTEERGIYYEIVTLDNAVTLGTAVAGAL